MTVTDIRAYISKLTIKLNERPDLSSNVPDVVGYRWFLKHKDADDLRRVASELLVGH